MSLYADSAVETSTTTGTGDLTLAGAVTGYRTLNAAVGTDVIFDYTIEAVDSGGAPTGEWETGKGYLSAATTLNRMQPDVGSAATPVSFSAGTKRVYISNVASNKKSPSTMAAMCFSPQMG